MRKRVSRWIIAAVLVIPWLDVGVHVGHASDTHHGKPRFRTQTGPYTVVYTQTRKAIVVSRVGRKALLVVRELGGTNAANLLASVQRVTRSGRTYTLAGTAKWATFSLRIAMPPATPGLIRLTLSVKPTKDAPEGAGASPDVTLTRAPVSGLQEYAAATPVAGNSVYLGDSTLGSTILYAANYTRLGTYFNRTKSGAAQPNFAYPGAGIKGSLVGRVSNSFGYEPPAGSLANLPRRRSTIVLDSFLYLLPRQSSDPGMQAEMYLRMIDTVRSATAPKPQPAADWLNLARQSAQNLADLSNWVTVNGHQYLRSYVSDTRAAPELLTQANVLAGIEAYEARAKVTLPMDATLTQDLPTFFDPAYGTVTNHVGHAPNARDESWYYVTNLIALLRLTQLGNATARQLLMQSIDGVIALAHANKYNFPVTFQYGVWSAPQSDLEPDVAGGYAWLMLGMYDLVGDQRYVDEAKAALATVARRGFGLGYELQMSAYTAAAAQRLYTMTGDTRFRAAALVGLANVFHATRLWECTYGLCVKGGGYHTYMGLNPLPTADYIAMLEQYEAWLALRDYARYDQGEPRYVTNLVQAFIQNSPLTLRFALPPALPSGAVTSTPGLYPFVARNNLAWNIPIEDLREGELQSGTIGQELYGEGGVFIFAAYGS